MSLVHATTWIASPLNGCEHLFTRAGADFSSSAEERERHLRDMRDPNAPEDRRRVARWALGLFDRSETEFLDQMRPRGDGRTLDDVFLANERSWSPAPERRPAPLTPPEPGYVTLFENIERQIRASSLFDGFENPRIAIETNFIKIKPYAEWSEPARRLYAMLTVGMDESERMAPAGSWIYGYFTDVEVHYRHLGGALAFTFSQEMPYFIRSNAEGPPPSLAALRHDPAVAAHVWPISSVSFRHWAIRPNPGIGNLLPIDVIDWDRSYFRLTLSRGSPTEGGWHLVMMMSANNGREILLLGGNSGLPQSLLRDRSIVDGLPRHWDRIPMQFRQLPRNLTEYQTYLMWLDSRPFAEQEPLPPKPSFQSIGY